MTATAPLADIARLPESFREFVASLPDQHEPQRYQPRYQDHHAAANASSQEAA